MREFQKDQGRARRKARRTRERSLPFISETGFAGTGTGTPYSTFRFDLHLRSTDAGPVLRPLLICFGAQFGVPLGSLFRSESESKMGPFFEQPPDGHLEATWEVSWLSWGSLGRPGVPDVL